MIQLLLLLPFALELPYDRYMLPQREVTWQLRTLMIISCVIAVYLFRYPDPNMGTWPFLIASWGSMLKYCMLSIAPYCFFDPALSAWRFGWKEWHRLGETKYWDRFMTNLQDLVGKWLLLFLRAVVCGLLIWWSI